MAQIPYRANLSSATYPLSLEKSGRTIINPGADQNFDRRVDPPGDNSKDVGIPQAIYMENTLPTYNGFQSVGYKPQGDLSVAANESINHIIEIPIQAAGTAGPNLWTLTLRSDDTVFAHSAPGAGAAVGMSGAYATPAPSENVSVAYVQGRTFLFVRGGVLFELVEVAGAIVASDITGTVTGIILAQCAFMIGAFNYLIFFFSDGTANWSSLSNPVDFTPSLVTGAGFETPGGVKAKVINIKEHPAGFIIYTRKNAIVGKYTGNRQYPWRFSEIQDSLGIFTAEAVVGSTNSNQHLTRASSGDIALVTADSAQIIIPDVSDYIQNSRVYSDFDGSIFVTQRLPITRAFDDTNRAGMFNQLNYLEERYLVVSYGAGIDATTVSEHYVFSFAFIYDTVLRRLGRLKFRHTHITSYNGSLYAWAGFNDGDVLSDQVFKIITDIYDQNIDGEGDIYFHTGVLALGKFQYVRNYNLVIEGIEIESVQPTPDFGGVGLSYNFSVKDFISYDGKNYIDPPISPEFLSHVGFLQQYQIHTEAKNHTIMISGAFDLASIALTFSLGGKPFG